MTQIRAKQARQKVKILESIIQEYKKNNPKKKRDYTKYEAEFKRIGVYNACCFFAYNFTFNFNG